jgi:hypothetical protein
VPPPILLLSLLSVPTYNTQPPPYTLQPFTCKSLTQSLSWVEEELKIYLMDFTVKYVKSDNAKFKSDHLFGQ